MPTYSIKAPNGKTYQIDGPAGASDAQVRQQVLRQYPDAASTAAPPPTTRAKTTPDKVPAFNRERLLGKPSSTDAQIRSNYDKLPAWKKPFVAADDIVRITANALTLGGADWLERKASGDKAATEERTRQAEARAGAAGVAAKVAGWVRGGTGASKLITVGGNALRTAKVAKAVPAVNVLGEALVGSQALQKGQAVKNVAKLALAGATGGAIEAGFGDRNVKQGAIYGAATGPAVIGVAKVAGFLARPVADIMHLSSAKGVLRRFTDATSDEIAKRADEYRATTGAEPTVYELLSLKDRLKIAKAVVGSSAAASEKTAQLVARRAANVGPEMASKADDVIGPERARIISMMEQDLAAARTGARPAQATGAEAQAAGRAAQSPADLELLRKQEASAIMAPHDNKIVFSGIDELMPTELRSIPRPDLPPKYTDKHIPEGDTRGAGVQYHGARGNVPELKEGYSNPANIYGGNETFYTTDAADIASGYQRKSAAGTVYKTEERVPVNKFDMEQRITPEEASALFGRDDLSDLAISEAIGQDGKINLREAMDEIRHLSQGEGYSRDDVQEIFDAAIYNLRQKGFGAMNHTGGLKTGKTPHNVTIYFDAPNQIKLIPLEKATATPRPPKIEETIRDPEVASMIRTVAGSLRLRDPAAGISGREVSDMLTALRGMADNSIEGRRAQAAINHIEDTIRAKDPQMVADIQRMTAAYAGRSRMMEGMSEGARGRTREAVPVTDRNQSQRVANAYDTPEGGTGRALGQINSLTRDLSGRPTEAVNVVGDLAENTQFQKALGANIGTAEADTLTAAAQAQGQGIRNLSSVAKESRASDLEGLNLPDVARSMMAMSPSSLPGTKVWAIARLMEFTHLPEGKALALVEKLFSQDPKMVQQGLNLLNSKASNGRKFLVELQTALQAGRLGAPIGEAMSAPGVPMVPEDPANEIPVEDVAPDEAIPEDGESPYAADLEQIYSAESPEFLDLIDRQFRQESGHRQFGSDGQPLTSSAGAIGVAQVMPGTAPIAAEMAGLPYDEQAYRTDPAYNKMLGMAYMSNMLQRYDGNVALALAAYNAGPGRVDKALSQGDNWFAHLPAETQNYVQAIL